MRGFWRCLLAIAFARVATSPIPASASPANTLKELAAEVAACAHVQGIRANAELTVALIVNRRGELMGRPRVTFSRSADDPDARQHVIDSVVQSISECSPLPISDELGSHIAGHVFTVPLIVSIHKDTNT